jgi:3-deoxy-D-manno-octulosonic-acid transferase
MKKVRLLYNLAFPFVLLALLPSFLLRMIRRGKYRHKFGQRFAIYSPRVLNKLRRDNNIWVHAVSVGEVLIALKLIGEMKKSDPSLRVVLSTTTSTGFRLASRRRTEWLEPIYNPVDFILVAKRAMRIVRPKMMILVEAEVWPNLTAEAKAQGAKLALVNARLSPRSESRYRMVKFLTAPLFNQLDVLCVQEEADAERWKSLGVTEDRIRLTGSVKFDDAAQSRTPGRDFSAILAELGVPAGAPILLAASTHAGEEIILGEIYLRLRTEFPSLFYVCVPRHAERGRQVKEELEKIGLRVMLRSGETNPPANPDALIINTTGELRDVFPIASVVFIGKSLTAKGGQNPVEALAAGKPVIFGRNMQNFASLCDQLVRSRAAISVADEAELETAIRDCLQNPEKAATLARRGAECLAQHRGATQRTVDILEALRA